MSRQPLDFYETDPRVTRALINRLRAADLLHPTLPGPGWICEPCIGDGAIAHVLEEEGCGAVYGNDIAEVRAARWHGDAGDRRAWERWTRAMRGRPGWVISNPPFKVATRIVPLAVEYATYATAMLLRISWLEPTKDRREFLRRRPPQHQLTTERISFRVSERGSRTDNVTTAWFIWTADAKPLLNIKPIEVLLWK